MGREREYVTHTYYIYGLDRLGKSFKMLSSFLWSTPNYGD